KTWREIDGLPCLERRNRRVRDTVFDRIKAAPDGDGHSLMTEIHIRFPESRTRQCEDCQSACCERGRLRSPVWATRDEYSPAQDTVDGTHDLIEHIGRHEHDG